MNENINIGLFFGSFNPIHIGHLIIANYIVQYTGIDKIWFIVSPQNPFKLDEKMLDEKSRIKLVTLAIANNPNFEASDIEFNMEQPSYTYKTLKLLKNKFPDNKFVLIIGSDNLAEFDKWKNYEVIPEMADIYVYPRIGFKNSPYMDHPRIKMINAPVIEISSSFIRKQIAEGKDPKYMLPDSIYQEIKIKGYYS